MSPEVRVGNDVVDLANPRTLGRATDERFLARVFTETERASIAAAPDPDLEVWRHWAAKEVGFKVVSKRLGHPPPFVHRAFAVTWNDDVRREPRVRAGTVRYEGPEVGGASAVAVTVEDGGPFVHAFGHGASSAYRAVDVHRTLAALDEPEAAWSGSLDDLTSRLTDDEKHAVYSRRSAAVRLGARAELAALLEVDEARVEIVCAPGPPSQRPPMVLVDGESAAADVSLSHDGPWIAWAIWTA